MSNKTWKMRMELDHEKLDVYRAALDFAVGVHGVPDIEGLGSADAGPTPPGSPVHCTE